jgi:hypothetical protein
VEWAGAAQGVRELAPLEPVTPTESRYVTHIRECARAWRWTAAEILASAEHYAEIDRHNLGRLPQLMRAEINNTRSSTAN